MARKEDWASSGFLREQIAQAAAYVAECAACDFTEYAEHIAIHTSDLTPAYESPLEAAFGCWWHAIVGNSGHLGANLDARPQVEVQAGGRRYRLDFAIVALPSYVQELSSAHLSWPKIAVELDGHAFHEKTVEQVTARNSRDRDLQAAGWTVFHVSYDEMRTRGGDAVAGIAAYVRDQFVALNSEVHRHGVAAR